MYWTRVHTFGRRFAVVALGSAAMLVVGAGGALAAGGYGPPAPVVPPAPGGFSAVVTSQSIGPAGGKVGPVSVDGVTVNLTVPAGAFTDTVQITLTAPSLAGIGTGGMAGRHAVAGVGVQVTQNGATYPGTFHKPLTVTMASSSINAACAVVVWNGAAFVSAGGTAGAGAATVSFDHDPSFAVLAPASSAVPPVAPIAGATGPKTGEPFLGEGILAGVLLVMGMAGLGFALRRRRAGA
jgi:hypothetical protein